MRILSGMASFHLMSIIWKFLFFGFACVNGDIVYAAKTLLKRTPGREREGEKTRAATRRVENITPETSTPIFVFRWMVGVPQQLFF